MTTEKLAVSAVLLPDENDAEQLIAFSKMLGEHIDSKIQLSDACPPHITLMQFFAAESCLDDAWQSIRAMHNPVTELFATGLGFVPDGKGLLWIELGFAKSKEFAALQSAIAHSEALQRLEPHGIIGDRSRPHNTLGLTEASATLPAIRLERETIFNRPFGKLRLAVGVNGRHWTLSEIRYRA